LLTVLIRISPAVRNPRTFPARVREDDTVCNDTVESFRQWLAARVPESGPVLPAWGFSRDDVEAAFSSTYLEMGVVGISPFETLDVEGVGEHGGDPDSVHFFHHAGLDNASSSPFRIPVARLEAGRVALGQT
jgi:PEP-utilising enzyme, PEP-binding domain